MNLKSNIPWILIPVFMLASCARQTSPTGGPKDTIPPILLRSIPTHEQTNFKQQSLELTFNEALLLNTPKEQIIITPGVGKDFDAEVNKTKLTLKFKNELTPNTTYAINLRDAVQDITEKNPAKNIKLAFSTGNYIDSLSIEGTIYDLLSSKEVKEATVALYQQDTFNIFKHRPDYITKTDLKGKYQIGNLKPGEYYIFAIDDKNKNLIADSKSESFGFKASKISITENIKATSIPLIRLDTRALKLTGARPSGTYFNIKTSKNLVSYKITNKEHEPIIACFSEEDHSNIRVYNTLEEKDSLAITIHGLDSVQNAVDTTLYLKFSKREAKPEAFKATNNGFRVTGTKGLLAGSVTLNKPLLNINFDSIYYQIDSANIIRITPQDITYDTAINLLRIKKTFDKTLLVKKEPAPITKEKVKTAPATTPSKTNIPKEKSIVKKPTEYQLYIAPKTFISIELDSSKLITETLQPTTLEKTGIITAEVKTKEKNYITQIVSKDLKIIKSTVNTTTSVFDDLEPGEYMLRLIIDTDGNGKWSPGNFFSHTEPEQIIFYKNEKGLTSLPLKANWETGPFLISY